MSNLSASSTPVCRHGGSCVRALDAEGQAEAIAAGMRGKTLGGRYSHHHLIRTYVAVGEPEKALDELELLLRVRTTSHQPGSRSTLTSLRSVATRASNDLPEETRDRSSL